MSLLSELKRRNVFRVALLYLVASWLVIQVADTGVSLLGLPGWTGRFVFLLLLIGFPLVIVFSWVYELTPEGLKREKDVVRDASITHETARKLNTAVIVLLLVAVGMLVADRFLPRDTVMPPTAAITAPATGPHDQSIAVLPFVNMSSDRENEYFSDGLSEELLNLLAKIPELKVAARTSSFTFKNSTAEIGEIARTLQVAHVLEGSVRKSGDDIRVTAQLIKASDGYHLWSETWDRKLVDVFAIQDEIAQNVVDALKVRLLGELPHAREADPEAYELYLQAKAASNLRNAEGYDRAIQLLTRALAVDPDYAEAWVELSTTQTNQVGGGYTPAQEGYTAARASAERALKLDPRNARAMSNVGWLAMYQDWDFETAAARIGEAMRLEPGNPSVLNAYAVLVGAFGRTQSMINYYEEALVRDPVAISVLSNLSGAYLAIDPARSAELAGRIRDIAPDSLSAAVFTGWSLQFAGDSELALDVFDTIEGMYGAWGRAIALYDLGRDGESDAALAELERLGGTPVMLSWAYARRGDLDKAFEWLNYGLEQRSEDMVELRMFAEMGGIRSDPRWEPLLADIGVSDADAERIGL